MIIDFMIGFFAVNALPHYLFGRLEIGILSLFGFSPQANLGYSAICLAVSLGLYQYIYGFKSIDEHMMFFGGLLVVLLYLISWDLVDRFLRRDV